MLGYLKRKVQEAKNKTNQEMESTRKDVDTARQEMSDAWERVKERQRARQVSSELADRVRGQGWQGVKAAHAERKAEDATKLAMQLAKIDYVYQDDNRIKSAYPDAGQRLSAFSRARKQRTTEWEDMHLEQRMLWMK